MGFVSAGSWGCLCFAGSHWNIALRCSDMVRPGTNVENHMCFYLSTKIEIFVASRDPFIEVSIILAGSIL